ncbi:MAG: ribonuclease H [Acidimicrobiia bacterium]|nr:ribonuclease H [Acidimicrobiia bacterium]
MPDFICRDCGDSFSLPQSVLDRYPGWVPKQCRSCRDAKPTTGTAPSGGTNADADPTTGVFTDGSSVPNPGPGGWGVVYVVDDEIIAERHGHDPDTTNNRMELTALLAALEVIPTGTPVTVYSDSNLAVRTITEWAEGWEKRGWKRKSGPVENLDLVKQVYAGYKRRPELKLKWIKAHVGFRWNEYADALAARWREE